MMNARDMASFFHRRAMPLMVAVILLAPFGCGPAMPDRVAQPDFSPTDVTRCVFELADRDGDGSLSRDELTAIPGLLFALTSLDHDKNGRLSAAELTDWLAALRESRVAITSAGLRVVQGDQPVKSAFVRIVPEPCMGNSVAAAEGRTDGDGIVTLSIPNAPIRGVHFGIYRLKISGKNASGLPIPARFNVESTLGFVVGVPASDGTLPTFDVQ